MESLMEAFREWAQRSIFIFSAIHFEEFRWGWEM